MKKEAIRKIFLIGLENVAFDQTRTGALSTAERNLRRSIDLCHEIADEFGKPSVIKNWGVSYPIAARGRRQSRNWQFRQNIGKR